MLLTSFILGYVAENDSFYVSLRAGFATQDQELMPSVVNNVTEWKELEENRYIALLWFYSVQ